MHKSQKFLVTIFIYNSWRWTQFLHVSCFLLLRLVVERYVIHAEVGLQALEGAVWRVHGTAAAVAAQGHGVGDGGVHAGGAVRELKCLVVRVPVRAHVLVHVAEWYLNDRVLEGAHRCVHFYRMMPQLTCTSYRTCKSVIMTWQKWLKVAEHCKLKITTL